MSEKKHVFTPMEKKLFLEILKKFSNIIENKETDGANLKAKNEAWDAITRQYNSSPHTTAQSTSKQLRRLWMNIKQRQREALTKERQHRIATGGGPSTSDAIIDPDVSLVAPALIVGIDEAIDSDTVAETEPMDLLHEELQIVIVPAEAEEEDQAVAAASIPSPAAAPDSTRPATATPSRTSMSAPGTGTTPLPTTTIQRKKSNILEKEYQDRHRRAEELHKMEMVLIKEKIREAKAKADLAELLLVQQRTVYDDSTNYN